MTRHSALLPSYLLDDVAVQFTPYRSRRKDIPCSHPQPYLNSSHNSYSRHLQCYVGQIQYQTKRDSSTLTKSMIPFQCQQDPTPLHRVVTRSRANLTTPPRGDSTPCSITPSRHFMVAGVVVWLLVTSGSAGREMTWIYS